MKTHKLAARIICLLHFCVALGSLSLWAQFTSAIAGSVVDPSGAVVPNAAVTIKNVETGAARSVDTSAAGYYRFSSLPAAMFSITVKAPGFNTLVQENLRLQVDETKTVNFTLQLGATTTQVTVTSEPPPVELSEARVSGLVSEDNVHELPLVGRNFYTLVVLTPGVTGLPLGGSQPYAQANADIFNQEYGVNMNASGLRSESNSFLVDSSSVNSPARGGVVNINPNAEDVQELRISVNDFSAENGHGAAALVNVITKQGTNDFHGSASWYHTDNALASRTFFQPNVPVFRRNEAAWSLGGPIRKDRTFFFSSMDILRSGVTSGFATRVATPDFINFMSQNKPNNISTKLLTSFPPVSNPTGGFLTAGNIAGANCSALPSPGTPIPTPIGPVPCNLPMTGIVNAAFTLPRNGTQWQARMDHMFNSSKDRLFGNVAKTNLHNVPSASVYPAFNPVQHGYTLNANLEESHTFSPTVINEMAVNYTRASGGMLCSHCDVPQVINVPGLAGFGNGGPATFVTQTFGWRDVLTWSRGAHSLKMGGNVWRPHGDANFVGILQRPAFVFPQGVFAFAAGSPFIEGNIGYDPRTGGLPSLSLSLRQWEYHLFFQDDWKVKRNLTVSLGIRYENFGNTNQENQPLTNTFFPSGNDFFSRVANASVDPVQGIWSGSDNDNWSPRIGFAWDPTNKGKTSIRAGVGMFYDYPFLQIPQSSIGNPPFLANATACLCTPPFFPAYGLGASGTAPFGFPRPPWLEAGLDSRNGPTFSKTNIQGSQRNFETAYTYNWFFGIQHALTNNWVVEVNYVGSDGHREYGAVDVNRFNGDEIKNNGVLTRLNHSFGSIGYIQPQFNSFYTGGNASIRSRASHGLTFQAAYTFGKSIDLLSATTGCCVDVTNLHLERGLSDFDVRQKLAVSLLYRFPQPHFRSSTVNKILGGWQIGDVTILQGGTPYSVVCSLPFNAVRNAAGVIVGNSGCDFNADGTNNDRLNQPAFGNNKYASRSAFINGIFTAADFPKPGLGQDGSLGRNTYIGPGFSNSDFSIMKNTKIPWFAGKEGANLEFRSELFNVFNRVNLVGLHNDIADPLFGKSTATFPARDIQFGLRLSF